MKTKFDIGDTVWFIRDNKPQSGEIAYITINAHKEIMYNVQRFHNLKEDEIFKTGKAAIESLYKELDIKPDGKEEMILS